MRTVRPITTVLLFLVPLFLGPAVVTADEGAVYLNPGGLHDASKYYTHIVKAPKGSSVFIAGQISVDPTGALVGAGNKEAQVRRAFTNLRTAIAAAGGKPEHTVKITVYSVDHTDADLAIIGAESTALWGKKLPASTLVPVPRLARSGLLFEIDAELVIPD
jgi:enamine deaminase RidA (YjgF/YER057c/UK114 family)